MPEPEYIAPPDRFPPRLASLGYLAAFLNNSEVILPPLCDVPAGPFLMGSDPDKDQDAQPDEQPQHWVTLGAYQIAMFPVTIAEYACFVHATNRTEPKSLFNNLTWAEQMSGRLDRPVVNVSGHDATAYAQWLVERDNQPWRLPSEAEWEKAARWDERTGVAHIYPWGDQFDASRANTREGAREATAPVGSYPTGASPYGALDMAGNVCEWTSTVFNLYPYTPTDDREHDDRGHAESDEGCVLRGGSWGSDARGARAAYRYRDPFGFLVHYEGFRVLLAVPSS